MRVLNMCKKSRYGLNPCYNNYCMTSSIGYSLIHQKINPISSKTYLSSIISNGSISKSQFSVIFLGSDEHSRQILRYNYSSKLFYSSYVNNQVSFGCIIDVIKGDANDMECRLNAIDLNQLKFILEILCRLNNLKVPAFRFFTWLKDVHPSYCRNADLCSLVVANCGLLGDYATMHKLLIGFRNEQICLGKNAFGFLPVSSTNMETNKKCVSEVIEVLNVVGGSCRNSGIHSLVEMLCSLNAIDLAKYVIEITERRVSCYNILVKHICIRGRFDDARNLFEEMRQLSCGPDCRTYNYLISSLCKEGSIDEGFAILQEMLGRGCSPNLISFETLIYFACRYGKSEQAVNFYNLMVSSGVKPRVSTHYAFIRGYFSSQQFEEAYRYVVNNSAEDKCLAQEIYNVLAGLHINDGDHLVGYNLIVEMLEKGLKPKHSIFQRATKCLHKSGKADFANNLKARYVSCVAG